MEANSDGTNEKIIFGGPLGSVGPGDLYFAWSPDGKQIGVLTRRIDADVVLLREPSTNPQ